MSQIKAGSYTRLSKFEACKYSAKLAYIDKIPEPERPLPPGKTEHANDRGSRMHDAAERFIKGGVELIPELSNFKPEFLRARELFAAGKASTEGDWAYNKEWEPVAWMSSDCWVRIKCDLVIHLSPSSLVVVDYKSGKRFGNEIKHGEQLHLYTLGTFLRFPKCQTVTSELWYLDLDEISSMTFRRDQGLRFLANYERRFTEMTSCEDFQPNPNMYSCRWCAYGPKGTKHCSVGVQ